MYHKESATEDQVSKAKTSYEVVKKASFFRAWLLLCVVILRYSDGLEGCDYGDASASGYKEESSKAVSSSLRSVLNN